MPGIVGIINTRFEAEPIPTEIEALVQPLMYYPWYRIDRLQLPGISAACVHTGILQDKSVLSTNEGIHILLHGEIYNDDIYEMSQLEYIRKCYRENGRDFVKKLNGSFAIVLVDEQKGVVILATDITRSKPIIYLRQGSWLYIAPELKSLLQVPGFDSQPNIAAVIDVMILGFVTNRRTLVEDAYFLESGSIMEISANGTKTSRYWHYDINEQSKESGIEHYEEGFAEVLQQAVKRQMRTSHKCGIFLSGGYDCRGILGCYIHEGKQPITISYGVPSVGNKYSDVAIAKKLAQFTGARHIHYDYDLNDFFSSIEEVTCILDGTGRPIAEWPIHKKIREEHGIEVVFIGDERFGRYDLLLPDEATMFACSFIYSLEQYDFDSIPFGEWTKDYLTELSIDSIKKLTQSCDLKNMHNRMDYFYFYEHVIPLLGSCRYASSTEVEIRIPWYDNDVLNFLAQVPAKYRVGKRLYKRTISKMFPELFQIEFARTVNKPTPDQWSGWISGNLPDIRRELFSGKSAVDHLFDSDKMLKLIQLDKSGDHRKRKLKSIIKSTIGTGKSDYNWITTGSPHWIYVIAEKLNKSLKNLISILPANQRPLILAKQRAIINIIRLRRTLKSVGCESVLEESWK